jgi:hypothetical protein
MKNFQIKFQHKSEQGVKMISTPFQIEVSMKDYQDLTLQKMACYGVLQKLYPNDSLQIISIN